VRSPYAHAKVKKIDITDAVKAPGVVAVYTARDFEGVILGPMAAAPGLVPDKKVPERFPLARDEVHYQGDPVALVVADSKGQAADAAQMIQVDYEPLPAVSDLEAALKPGAAKAHSDLENNISWDLTMIPEDATADAFKNAEVVVKERIYQQRLAPVQMEPRAVLAEWAEFDGQLTIWMSTQNPHLIRLPMAMTLGLGEHKVRIISHDVGGYAAGFCTFMAIALIVSGGGYKWPAISARTIGVFTNKTPTDAYRGAGRPEATHLVERMMDLLAAEIGMDPAELRRKNFVQPSEFPFTQNFGFVVDSGDYEKA